MKAKAAPSKGVTPNVTTAATSRQTQSPTRKPARREDSAEKSAGRKSLAPTSQRKQGSAARDSAYQTPQVPKPLKSAFKSRPA